MRKFHIFVLFEPEFMERAYLDILKDWERRIADPVIFERLDVLFPAYSFRRLGQGSDRDRWVSRYKLDLSLPRVRNAEKTVVYRSDMHFREQGNWQAGVRVMDMIIRDQGCPSVYEAYRYVSDRFTLDMPLPDSRKVKEAVSRSLRRTSLLESLTDYFSAHLWEDRSRKAASVRQYLKNHRGFPAGQASALRLGFVPDWSRVVRHVTSDLGFRIEELDEVCGVRNADGKTSVGRSHTLSIPYVCAGEVKGFLFRRVDDSREGPKYIATKELDRKSVFFNIPADGTPREIIIVEGEMDALKATAEGVPGVVAIGGSDISGDRRLQVEDAFRRGVTKITLCLDLDSSKDDPSLPNHPSLHDHLMRSIHTIKDVAPSFEEIYIALFPCPSDPDEFIRSRGGEAFIELISAAVPYWKYAYDYYMNGANNPK